jgi:acetate kinase
VIVAHLGSGASLCALRARKSAESTLGFTALDGLCMGTRPGSLDPGVVPPSLPDDGTLAAEVEKLLYKQSGLLGISGISNDMRALVDNPDRRPPGGRLLRLPGREARGRAGRRARRVDALVFTAGIGERSAEIRRRICERSGGSA